MSVLSCDREGCENVMCSRLSHKYGYICDECFAELLNNPMISPEVFMCTPKVFTMQDRQTFEDRRQMLYKEFPYTSFREEDV